MTVSCETIEARLIDHHHGELSVSETEETAAHLCQCSDCALEYCRLQADIAGVQKAWEAEPSPTVHRRLRAQVAKSFRPSAWERITGLLRLRVPVYQLGIAGGLIALVAVTVTSLPSGEEASTSSPRSVLENFDGSTIAIVDENLL